MRRSRKRSERKPRRRSLFGPHEPSVRACPRLDFFLEHLCLHRHHHHIIPSHLPDTCLCPSHPSIMIQRTLFRASRQAARPVQRLQPAFAPIRQQLGTRAAPAIRCYSDAPAAEAKKEDTATEAKTENSEAAQVKGQLEKKDKEIIDLKV